MSRKASFKKSFRLPCCYGEGKPITVSVEVCSSGALIINLPKGYECCGANDNSCILLENRRGEPALVVWADILEEDPTHMITFEDARIERLPKEEKKK